eukprot:TRINITY_DN3_c0_g1_i1.p2 TRINITY_DN3_c0_g1~~TRINITY_DN3_c0_g1_i1.p2  ORF type:complete len:498 (+),score=37.39 TRINITY_DN3_c0_g1_i1:4024-5517(+)
MEETADEKRLRMAKSLLSSLAAPDKEADKDEEHDEEKGLYAENEQDLINKKLKLAYLEKQGRIFKEYTPRLHEDSFSKRSFLKGHKKAITCLEISKDSKTCYTGAKDCCIIRWDLATGAKTILKGEKHNRDIEGHYDEVLSIALSEDEKLLLSAGKDRVVRLWDIHNQKMVHTFKGHKDTITVLFILILQLREQERTQLPTISIPFLMTALLKCGTCPSVPTLTHSIFPSYNQNSYGHKREGLCMETYYKDKVITGGSDGQAILWKLSDETQLLYKSSCQALDCIHTISEKYFASTGDNSTIELWAAAKKSPIFTLGKVHDAPWICSMAGMKNSDLLATGSVDGYVNLYKFAEEKQTLEKLQKVPLNGSINAMQFGDNANMLVCAQGDEQRLGRWIVRKEAKPGITIFTGLLTDGIQFDLLIICVLLYYYHTQLHNISVFSIIILTQTKWHLQQNCYWELFNNKQYVAVAWLISSFFMDRITISLGQPKAASCFRTF